MHRVKALLFSHMSEILNTIIPTETVSTLIVFTPFSYRQQQARL
jgi:hypothetical protein